MRAVVFIGLTALAAGLFLTNAQGAEVQGLLFRPALDAIGNAEPPASESSQTPDDMGFGPLPAAPAPRGRVIVESGTTVRASGPPDRRRIIMIQP